MFTVILMLIFIILLLLFLIFFVAQFYNIAFRGFAPFVSTRRAVINQILMALDMDPTAIVYELGCGKAGFLRALRRRYPEAKLVGIEYSFMPYVLGRIQNSLAKSKLELLKQNMFKADIGEADVVYCYLNGGMMGKLERKFREECKNGATVVSYQFPLRNLTPEKTIEIDGRQDKVYFYKVKK